jgi:Fur family ferric uptake transcriptional regulator
MQARRQREQADVDALMDQFHAYLAKNQLKTTRQRDLIACSFFSLEDHVSIEELLALSRQQNPRIGYATVYRTLKLLTECGLAAMRRFGDGQTMYETAGDTEHHDHLICIECSHVLEFQNEAIEREQERVARSFGFDLVRHRLELYGLCPKARGIKGGSCPSDDAKRASERTQARDT